jgi:hypothetical protein
MPHNHCLEDEEKGRERETLPKDPRSLEEGAWASINQRCNTRNFYTGLDPSDEVGVKPKFDQDLNEETVSDPIKSVFHVKLDHHAPFTYIFT